MASAWPPEVASCRGVCPRFPAFTLGSAPAAKRAAMASRGVAPRRPRAAGCIRGCSSRWGRRRQRAGRRWPRRGRPRRPRTGGCIRTCPPRWGLRRRRGGRRWPRRGRPRRPGSGGPSEHVLRVGVSAGGEEGGDGVSVASLGDGKQPFVRAGDGWAAKTSERTAASIFMGGLQISEQICRQRGDNRSSTKRRTDSTSSPAGTVGDRARPSRRTSRPASSADPRGSDGPSYRGTPRPFRPSLAATDEPLREYRLTPSGLTYGQWDKKAYIQTGDYVGTDLDGPAGVSR